MPGGRAKPPGSAGATAGGVVSAGVAGATAVAGGKPPIPGISAMPVRELVRDQ